MWAGSFSSQRPKGIRRCLFPVVRREPDTPQPSVCFYSFSLSNFFSFKTAPLRNIYGGHDDLFSMLRQPSSLMPLLIPRSIGRRCRLPLLAISRPFPALLIRFGRSSRPCTSSSFLLHRCSPRESLLLYYYLLLFAFFRSSLPGLSLYSLSTHTMFHYFTLVWNVPFYGISRSYLLSILSPHLRPFGPVSFPSFASPVRSIAFYVSCFDAPLNLCRLAFETLASR
ncbi:hypothetical protein BJ322DRAFT_137642 [Thelephora terrestris]|uniref:Transmembrane protein n=1 Tax=Thelephora terrestris TaxID=56493 RepID=A0A9P6HB49_9AGAM|nr:hypothetical protein BJ322DRAFT_137642 [Thelephora terrestris]